MIVGIPECTCCRDARSSLLISLLTGGGETRYKDYNIHANIHGQKSRTRRNWLIHGVKLLFSDISDYSTAFCLKTQLFGRVPDFGKSLLFKSLQNELPLVVFRLATVQQEVATQARISYVTIRCRAKQINMHIHVWITP